MMKVNLLVIHRNFIASGGQYKAAVIN